MKRRLVKRLQGEFAKLLALGVACFFTCLSLGTPILFRKRQPHSEQEAAVASRLSRLGLHVGFIAIFAVLGGALRGFNLLLIVAGLLVGALILQWRFSRRIVELLKLTRIEPSDAFSGTPFTLIFTVSNLSRWIPAWLILLEDKISPPAELKHLQPVAGQCGVGFLLPNSRRECQYQCVIHQRGRYHLGPTKLSTGFPFGFSTARKRPGGQEADVYIYPRLLNLSPQWQRIIDSRSGGLASTSKRSGVSEGDFYGLREWQHGDSRRWVHWRTTARLDQLAVRQFEQQRRHEMCLLLDASFLATAEQGAAEQGAAEQGAAEQQVERAIRLAATLVMKLSQVPSNRITLVVVGRETKQMVVTSAPHSLRDAMRLLAEVAPAPVTNLVPALATGLGLAGSGRPILVVSPHTPDEDRLTSSALELRADQLDLRWLGMDGGAAQALIVGDALDATA